MKLSCEKLTSAIQNVKALLPRVDSAIYSFDSNDGVLAMEAFQEELRPYLFRGLFKKETYNFLIKVFGNEKKLKKRTGLYETTGLDGIRLGAKLEEKRIQIWSEAEYMFESPDFEVAQAGEKYSTIRLENSELFFDDNKHTYLETLARAEELGFDILPHETAANLFLNKKIRPKKESCFMVVSKPITDQYGDPNLFAFHNDSYDGLFLDKHFVNYDHQWRSDSEFMFSLRKLED
jgi:hypothetical protein